MLGAGRREMGFSQQELAEIMERDEADLALWEAGVEVPSDPTTVMELAAALKLEPDVMMAAAEEADTPDSTELELEIPAVEEESAPDASAETKPANAAPPDTSSQPPPAQLGSDVVTRTAPRAAAPSPGQVAVARAQMPAPAPSYLEDDKLVRLYRIRLIATAVVSVFLLFLLFWALGNFFDAIKVLWDSLAPGGGV